ncbi:hypothetical protein EYF80_030638 [Liparis tanakae]|uniref:Uncharacterized protein n=1 Tax=Liparis tanakae TaxID=230148 RepID=A0A4Z2H2R4_9TELE|nr:hypothetical protein EYF80_030638 [Liparis tanakae]
MKTLASVPAPSKSPLLCVLRQQLHHQLAVLLSPSQPARTGEMAMIRCLTSTVCRNQPDPTPKPSWPMRTLKTFPTSLPSI